jgi:hypothetical protein
VSPKYFSADEGSTPAATVTDPSSRLLLERVAVRALVNLIFHERKVDATRISGPRAACPKCNSALSQDLNTGQPPGRVVVSCEGCSGLGTPIGAEATGRAAARIDPQDLVALPRGAWG